MKHVLAISGGVDSVLLLDMAVKGLVSLRGESRSNPDKSQLDRHASKPARDDIIVAHFDHGIRENSRKDAEFVKKLAEKYGVKFVLGKGNLGKDASEDLARKKRYEFLQSIAASLRGGTTKQSRKPESRVESLGSSRSTGLPRDFVARNDATIVTAHHQDDLIETILINLIRGTGWRGLAPFYADCFQGLTLETDSSSGIVRPLLGMTKAEIIEKAIENKLEWVEDETNFSHKYFRNRVRNISTRMTSKQREQLIKLYEKQSKLRTQIENELDSSLRANAKQSRQVISGTSCSHRTRLPRHYTPRNDITLNRKEIMALPEEVAVEVLRRIVNAKLTIPQTKRLLKSLKTAKSGDIIQPGGKIQVGIYKDSVYFSKL